MFGFLRVKVRVMGLWVAAALILPGKVSARPPEAIQSSAVESGAPDSAAAGISPTYLRTLLGRSHPVAVLVFLAPECPLSIGVTTALNTLSLRPDSIGLVGIVPRLKTRSAELAAFRTQQAIQFPLIGDPDLELVQALRARVTPEAFLLDSTGKVLYHGAVDNRATKLGKKSPRPTRSFLDTALAQRIQNRPIEPRSTTAVGCFIQ